MSRTSILVFQKFYPVPSRTALEGNGDFLAGVGNNALKDVGDEKGLPYWEALKSIYFTL